MDSNVRSAVVLIAIGANAIPDPAASELIPIAKSGRLSLKLIRRSEHSANCMEIPRPLINSETREIRILCENQKIAKPINCRIIIVMSC